MKKWKVLFFSIIVFLLGVPSVVAVCTSEENNTLNRLASNVTVDYETLTEEYQLGENDNPPDGLTPEELDEYVATRKIIMIYISNITEDLYVTVRNDNTYETVTYTYADAENGVISIRKEDISEITNYTITVYTSEATNCRDTRLRTMYLTTPMYNYFTNYSACEGAEDFYLCYEYLSVPGVTESRFLELVDRYKAGQINNEGEEVPDEEETEQGFLQFIQDNIVLTVVIVVVVIAAVGVVVVIIIKRRRRIV